MSVTVTERSDGRFVYLNHCRCEECGIWFAVQDSFVQTGRTIHCPAGHKRPAPSANGTAPDGIRFLEITRGGAVHVLGSGTQWCHHYRRGRNKMRLLPADVIRDPWAICTHCRKSLDETELEKVRDVLRSNGADVELFTGF